VITCGIPLRLQKMVWHAWHRGNGISLFLPRVVCLCRACADRTAHQFDFKRRCHCSLSTNIQLWWITQGCSRLACHVPVWRAVGSDWNSRCVVARPMIMALPVLHHTLSNASPGDDSHLWGIAISAGDQRTHIRRLRDKQDFILPGLLIP
jgi:hypothetical protein